MDVDFTLEDDIEMVSRFVFTEDDRPIARDALTAVGGEPVILILSKLLKAVDIAQRGHNIGNGRRTRRRYRAYSVGLIRKSLSHGSSTLYERPLSSTPLFRGEFGPSRFSALHSSVCPRSASSDDDASPKR